jgi:hypothetical protein
MTWVELATFSRKVDHYVFAFFTLKFLYRSVSHSITLNVVDVNLDLERACCDRLTAMISGAVQPACANALRGALRKP